MTHPPAAPVTIHVWRVPGRRIPQALWRIAQDRARLRGTPGIRFAKLVGTGTARWFVPTKPDPTRWAAIIAWDGPVTFDETTVARSWRTLARGYCRLDLAPIASRGSWSGERPFSPPRSPERSVLPPRSPERPLSPSQSPERPLSPPRSLSRTAPATDDGPVLALTRARLSPSLRRAAAFYRSVPAVGTAAYAAAGLLATFAFGEAPLGWQGTISVWRSARDLAEFAYRHPAHRRVVDRTPVAGWYAEELFARFAVLRAEGDLSVIGWTGRWPTDDRIA